MKSVRRGARYLWRVGFEKKKLRLENRIKVVMMTLVMWDDCGEEMNQEEADQDVADEVSEVMHSE